MTLNIIRSVQVIVITALTLIAPSFAPLSVTAADRVYPLQASVSLSDRTQPKLTLSNTGTEACQVVTTSVGTVSVSRMIQNKKEIIPEPLRVGFDESPEEMLARQLKTLNPGESVEIPLNVSSYKGNHALETVSWSRETGGFGFLYQFDSKQPYELELSYAVPFTPKEGAPACDPTTTTRVEAGTKSSPKVIPWLPVLIILVLILLFIFLFVFFRKKRNRKHVGKAAIVLAILISGLLVRSARAEYSVPESAVPRFNECLALFESHPDITGPVLDMLDGGTIIIHRTTGGVNYASDYPDGTYHIHWDSDSEYNYYSEGAPIPSTPCDRLFHEMYHIYELMNGTFSRDDCAGSGIETKEVNAVRAQNRLREAMGLPPRTHYGTDRLPAGECSEPPPSEPTCSGGCGKSTGDPHLHTFDKLRYDFMAVGEFILSRDPKGDFEVQVRQQPWVYSRTVSINTAAAMRVGTDRISVEVTDSGMKLWINGKEMPLESAPLAKGTVQVEGKSVTVRWEDGSAVFMRTIGSFGLDVVVDPAQSRAGSLQGLLGNFNGESHDDVKARDSGTVITPSFTTLYPAFADSWRVTDVTSLFTYEKGKNTAFYTDRTFPDKEVVIDGIPNKAAAEAICREMGVTDEDILENCIIDVAFTGRPEFARSAAYDQGTVSVQSYGGETWNVTIDNTEKAATVQFEGTKDEKVYIDLVPTTLESACGTFLLEQPSGERLTTGCIINGRGEIDGTVLPETGTYTISLRSSKEGRYTGTIRLIRIADQTGNIEPDGAPVNASIEKPGIVSRFTFPGQANQKVFVTLSEVTLPAQCGGINIRQPGGGILKTGCMLSDTGVIDTSILPETGTYTLELDPSGNNTGTAMVRLTTVKDFRREIRTGESVRVVLDTPGAIGDLSFTGRASQRVFITATESTLPAQCGGFRLDGPDDRTLASGCMLNGSGEINEDGIALQETGTYRIVIDPSETAIGEVTIQLK